MLTDFTDDCPYDVWAEALTHTHRREITARVLDLDHRRLAWIDDIGDGDVTMDVTNREASRKLTLQLWDPSMSLGWEPTSPSSLPRHLRRMVQVFDNRAIPGYGWISCPVFCGPVDEMDRDGAEVSLIASGKERLLMGNFGETHHWEKGRKIVEVIRHLLMLGGEDPSRIHLPDLPAELQKDLNVGRMDKPLPHARRLAANLDCVLFSNGRGHWIMRRKPTHATMTAGRDLLVEPVRIDRPRLIVHNRWVVLGKKPKGNKPRVSADVRLPASNPYSGVARGREVNGVRVPYWDIEELDRPHAETKAECREIGERKRDERIRFQGEIGIDILPFPNYEEWDLIRANDRYAGTAVAQVRQATLPLVSGPVTIGAVRKASRGKRHGGYHPPTHGGL